MLSLKQNQIQIRGPKSIIKNPIFINVLALETWIGLIDRQLLAFALWSKKLIFFIL